MAERVDFHAKIRKNRRWTWVLLFAFFVLLALVFGVAAVALGGGWIAVGVALALAVAVTTLSYGRGSNLALRATRARAAPLEDFPQLHNLVESMAIASGLPKPRVYVVDDPAPNAFATGRDPEHAAVAVTSGLLAKLDRDELEGVIAHELAHVGNYDIRVMTVAVATAGSIALIADVFWRMMFWGAMMGGGRRGRTGTGRGGGGHPIALVALVLLAVLAPLAAMLLKASISRRRESLADATAVSMTRYPTGLRRALEKLHADTTVVRHTSHATSHLWLEAPDDCQLGHKGARFNRMFNTHPPLTERIDLLRSMEGLESYTGPDPELVAEMRRRHAEAIGADPEVGVAGGPAGAAAQPAAATMPGLEELFPAREATGRRARRKRPHGPRGSGGDRTRNAGTPTPGSTPPPPPPPPPGS